MRNRGLQPTRSPGRFVRGSVDRAPSVGHVRFPPARMHLGRVTCLPACEYRLCAKRHSNDKWPADPMPPWFPPAGCRRPSPWRYSKIVYELHMKIGPEPAAAALPTGGLAGDRAPAHPSARRDPSRLTEPNGVSSIESIQGDGVVLMRQFPQDLSITECRRCPSPSATPPPLHTRFAAGRIITQIRCVSPCRIHGTCPSRTLGQAAPIPFWMNLERQTRSRLFEAGAVT